VSQLEAWRGAFGRTSATSGDDGSMRTRSIVTVALMIARAALRREESRGGHFRQDFPNRDDIHWKVHFTDCADR
jgi:succinate dehydrogenase/fumarate reductase flavoprotein subunit